MAIVGGTASKLGGGKFSNGAVSGAFVHMFNAEGNSLVSEKGQHISKSLGVIKTIKKWFGIEDKLNIGVELARIDKEVHVNIDRWEASGADSVKVYAIRREWMEYMESVKLKWAVQ